MRSLQEQTTTRFKRTEIGTLFDKIGLGGGLWTCPKVRGTCARVQAAGRVKPMKQQFTPNLQDCASMKYLVEL